MSRHRRNTAARLAALPPRHTEELPGDADTECILQLVDFAACYSHTVLVDRVNYYLPMLLATVRLHQTNSPVRISSSNQVAKELRKFFSPDSRIWAYIVLV